MSKFTDEKGKFRTRNEEIRNNGDVHDKVVIHDRYTWSDGGHTHDWTKTDLTTGHHIEGSAGPGAQRSDDKK